MPNSLLTTAQDFIRSYFTTAGKLALRNLGWLIVCTVLTQAAALATVLILTGALSQARFGMLIFALTVQNYLFLVGSGGVKSVVIREATRRPDQLDQIVTAHFVITLLGSTLVCVLILLTVLVTDISPEKETLLIIVAVGNVAAAVSISPLFDVHHAQPLSAAISLVTEAFGLLAVVLLWFAGPLTVMTVGIIYASKWTLTSAGHYLVYHHIIRPIRPIFSATVLRTLLRSSWPMLISALVATIPISSGALFLGLLATEIDTAIFGLAYQVAYAYQMFAMLGNRIVQPHIAGPYGFHPGFILKLIWFSTGFLVLLWLGTFVAGTIVIVGMLKSDYEAAILPMAILLLGMAAIQVCRLTGAYLLVLHREQAILISSAAGAVLYVAGALLLIPVFSYYAAAGLTLAAGIFIVGLNLIQLRQR